MAYSQGGLIAPADYNNFVGVSPSSTANTINTVWAVGNGQYGYGQTALSQSATQAQLVTATQWATLINTLNSIRTHQSGSGSGISAVTAGSLINYLSTLSTAVTAGYTNALSFNAQGTTQTGSVYSPNMTYANNVAAETLTFTRTITFASADQARYFFNAGGQINFITTSMTNGDASGRSADLCTLAGTNLANITAIRATTNGGRSGTGGTANTNNTALGYYSLTTSAQNISNINSTGYAYTGDYVTVAIRSNGVQGSNADKGTIVYLDFTLYAAALPSGDVVAQSINVTWNHRIDIVFPETTNLASSWGAVTVS